MRRKGICSETAGGVVRPILAACGGALLCFVAAAAVSLAAAASAAAQDASAAAQGASSEPETAIPIAPPPYDPDNDPLRPPRIEAPPIARLRVLLIDLSTIVENVDKARPTTDAGAFRHTFGSRRYTPPEQQPLTFDPISVDADIVLMPEVVSFRLARKIFPSRGWRVVRARTAGESATAYNVAQLDSGGPAIAVRVQRGVRIAGVDPQLRSPDVATARLIVGSQSLWLGVCAAPDATTPDSVKPNTLKPRQERSSLDACASMAAWAARRRGESSGVVVGGGITDIARAQGGDAVAIDVSAKTAMPIAAASPVLPVPIADEGVVIASEAACRSDDGAPMRVLIYPEQPVATPFKMLAWHLPLAEGRLDDAAGVDAAQSRTVANERAGIGDASRGGPPSCALIAQIAPQPAAR